MADKKNKDDQPVDVVSQFLGGDGDTSSAFVALIGAPNAGKSTLLNALVGAKVAIVTHKVQTTRTRLTGIAQAGKAQLVFIDTPGIFAPKRRLDRAMVQAAWQGADDAELVVLLIDSKKGLTEDVEAILENLKNSGRRAFLALNKVDLIRPEKLLALSKAVNDRLPFEETFMISAANGDGVSDLKAALANTAPPGPWMYPEDQVADITLRLMAAEMTREQVYLNLHDELPYSIMVETEAYKEQRNGSVRIEQVIHVQRDSQKGMVIGKGGSMLKRLGERARAEMEASFDQKVHLFLHVRVTPRWQDDRLAYKDMGLDYVD